MQWNRPGSQNASGFKPKFQFGLQAGKTLSKPAEKKLTKNALTGNNDTDDQSDGVPKYRPSLRFTEQSQPPIGSEGEDITLEKPPSPPVGSSSLPDEGTSEIRRWPSPERTESGEHTLSAPESLSHDQANIKAVGGAVLKEDEEEEEDPLEAFMAGIDRQVQHESSAPKKSPPFRAERLNKDDPLDNFQELEEASAANPGMLVRTGTLDNSDDEVYEAARLADERLGDSESTSEPLSKDVEPLAAIDHSSIAYIPIEKNFYQEHPDVSRLNDAEVSQLRRDLDISVRGAGVPRLGLSFAHFGLDTDLLDGIAAHGYREPTTIQKQAIPTALTGRDIIGIAQTGSGKTAAFILPLLVHLLDQPELEPGEGPIGLILAPTRELVQQIHREARQFAGVYGGGAVRCRMAYGGTSRMVQFRELRHSTVDILVATPGRLIDLVKMKATSLRRVSYLVLDEADRMLDLGFEPQVRSICERIRPDRQTLLFSATFPRKIDHLARQITRDPVRIAIGQIGEANSDIRQHFHILPDDTAKWEWLRVHITPYCIEGSVLIFVARMGEVDILAEGLHAMGIECGTIHGGMMQSERDRVIRDFKNDKLSVVVATDVAARGLDIKSIRTVINYDPARDIDSHVHRIGRTGRAGIKGDAHTLLSAKESKAAGDLVRLLESAGDSVPTEVMSLAMQNPKFRQSRDWTSHRGRRGGGRGGRGGRGRGAANRQWNPRPGANVPDLAHLSPLTAGARLAGDRSGIGASGPNRPSASQGRSNGPMFRPASKPSEFSGSHEATPLPSQSQSQPPPLPNNVNPSEPDSAPNANPSSPPRKRNRWDQK